MAPTKTLVACCVLALLATALAIEPNFNDDAPGAKLVAAEGRALKSFQWQGHRFSWHDGFRWFDDDWCDGGNWRCYDDDWNWWKDGDCDREEHGRHKKKWCCD